jgi:hypothetical protein
MAISTADIRGVFTKTLIDVYQERKYPTSFLRSFFPTETVPTKTVSIEVERMGEKIAVDVQRGTEGNRNTFSRSTEKIFEPPYFREYFDMTELDLYDRVLGSQGNAQLPLFKQLLITAADKLGTLRDKIERAKEYQCSQVLETGILTFNTAMQIDFKRKAASIVDLGAGNYFANNVDPFAVIETGCKFIREVGRSGDFLYNAITGRTALADLLNNTKFLTRQNQFNMVLDKVTPPVGSGPAIGATFHGTLTAGSYKVQLWAYPQVYDKPVVDANGNPVLNANGNPTYTTVPYWNDKKICLIPINPRFRMAHAAVPMLIGEPGQLPQQGEYVMMEFLDTRKAKHDLDIQSAPVAIPVAVDQIYTVQVSA